MSALYKIYQFFKYMKFWKDGGITQLRIAQVDYGRMLEGRKAVVTGGGSGIGWAIAKKLNLLGSEVLIVGRDDAKLRKAQQEIGSDRVHVMQWDVTDFDHLESKVDEACRVLGGVDILINNAAYLKHKSVTMESFDNNIKTNLKAVYFVSMNFANRMISKGGKIINISSVSSFQGETNPYHISKAALNTFTKGLAKEMAPYNVIVNSIAPGYCASAFNYMDTTKNAYFERAKNHRITTPEEIAELAAFLCSDAANGIVGQIIVCDGGTLL